MVIMRKSKLKKEIYIIVTIVIMLIVSRFAVRIVDATVQIDGNYFVLSLFLIAVNAVIGILGCKLYRLSNITADSVTESRGDGKDIRM